MEKKEHNAEIDKEKKIKNSSFIDAWKNAINGIIYATTTQANIKKQLVIAVAVVIISLFFNLSKAEFLIFLFTHILHIFLCKVIYILINFKLVDKAQLKLYN